MLIIFKDLDWSLVTGILPHHFNPDCNLLENVPQEELDIALSCVGEILYDPVSSMVTAPCNTSRLQGSPEDLDKLQQQFKNAAEKVFVEKIASLAFANTYFHMFAPKFW